MYPSPSSQVGRDHQGKGYRFIALIWRILSETMRNSINKKWLRWWRRLSCDMVVCVLSVYLYQSCQPHQQTRRDKIKLALGPLKYRVEQVNLLGWLHWSLLILHLQRKYKLLDSGHPPPNYEWTAPEADCSYHHRCWLSTDDWATVDDLLLNFVCGPVAFVINQLSMAALDNMLIVGKQLTWPISGRSINWRGRCSISWRGSDCAISSGLNAYLSVIPLNGDNFPWVWELQSYNDIKTWGGLQRQTVGSAFVVDLD